MVSTRKDGEQQQKSEPNLDQRTIRTYTREERWATGKGWGPGGKGCVVPKKKSQWITPEEYEKIQLHQGTLEKFQKLFGKVPTQEVEDEKDKVQPNSKASDIFDWEGFMRKSKEPMIVNYLEEKGGDFTDLKNNEHWDECDSSARKLENYWYTEMKLKQEYASLMKTMQSFTGRIPGNISKSVAACRKKMKVTTKKITNMEQQLECDINICLITLEEQKPVPEHPAPEPSNDKEFTKNMSSRPTPVLDWTAFLKKCTNPTIVKYLDRDFENPIDFNSVETCTYTANRLVTCLASEDKISREQELAKGSKGSRKGVSKGNALKEVQISITRLVQQLEGRVALHIDESWDGLKCLEKVEPEKVCEEVQFCESDESDIDFEKSFESVFDTIDSGEFNGPSKEFTFGVVDVDVGAGDIEERDIELVMSQVDVSRAVAINSIREANYDVIDAIMNIAE